MSVDMPLWFYGHPGEDVSAWIRHVERRLYTYGIYDDRHAADFAFQGLLDNAGDWFSEQTPEVQDSWFTLKEGLIARFGKRQVCREACLCDDLQDTFNAESEVSDGDEAALWELVMCHKVSSREDEDYESDDDSWETVTEDEEGLCALPSDHESWGGMESAFQGVENLGEMSGVQKQVMVQESNSDGLQVHHVCSCESREKDGDASQAQCVDLSPVLGLVGDGYFEDDQEDDCLGDGDLAYLFEGMCAKESPYEAPAVEQYDKSYVSGQDDDGEFFDGVLGAMFDEENATFGSVLDGTSKEDPMQHDVFLAHNVCNAMDGLVHDDDDLANELGDAPLNEEVSHHVYEFGLGALLDRTSEQVPVQQHKVSLVDMYAKCALVEEALEEMDELPLVENLVNLLQECRKEKSLEHVKRLHVYMCSNGLEAHEVLGNYLVPALVDCGSISNAQWVFSRLPYRNEYSWTSLLHGCVDCGESELVLNLYKKMQEEHVQPSRYTFIALLKACSLIDCIGRGREIHAEIAEKGFDRDSFVGNTLVDMYAKCGSVAEAWDVFDGFPFPDVVSWNALIAGYAEQGLGKEALNFLELMQAKRVSPDAITFICSLKACSYIGATDRGRKLHMEIINRSLEMYSIVGNSLVHMYAKCGSLLEAQQAFSKLEFQDIVSWNILIAGYAEYGFGEEALKSLEHMKSQGMCPDTITFVCILKACGSVGTIDKGRETHTSIVKQGLETASVLGNSLVDMYCNFGSLAESKKVFDGLRFRDAVCWNALLTGFSDCEPGEEALNFLEQMQLEGVSSNAITSVCSLKASGRLGVVERGWQVHVEVAKKGFDRLDLVCNTLVCMYAKYGSLVEARKVFDGCAGRDTVSWNALLTGYAEHECGEEALNCWEQMLLDGVPPNAVTFICSLKACGGIGALARGQEIHTEICKRGLDGDPFLGNTLVDMYAKCCSLLEGQEVFDKLTTHEVVLWNTLAAGYAENGMGEKALSCLEQMQLEGVSPVALTYAWSLRACGSIGLLDRVQELHVDIAKKGFDRDPSVGNTLVDVYAKCSSLVEGRDVLNKLPVQDVLLSLLFSGYAEHEQGLGEKTLDCLHQMQLKGVPLNLVTCICCLKACGNVGAIGKGQEVYAEITKKGYEQNLFVGSSLVDMYGRCDSLAEAEQVFHKLPIQELVSWTALIAGYASKGLGSKVLSCLEQMQLGGVSPSGVTFMCGLRSCGSIGALDMGRGMHAEIVKQGFERDCSVGNMLSDMYAKCGSFAESWKVFDKLSVRDVVSWTALIAGYTQYGFNEEVLNCLEQMQLEGIASPDAITYVCSMKACSIMGEIEKGREIHGYTVKQGLERNLHVNNAILDMYAKCSSFVEMQCLFNKMSVRDAVSWNVLMAGYHDQDLNEEALNCLPRMALEGVSPGAVTLVCSLKACCSKESLHRTQVTHSEIVMKGFERDTFVGNTLVDVYVTLGSLAEGGDAFNRLEAPDVVSWSVLIAGYAEHGLGGEALACLKIMQVEGLSPDAVTFSCILRACRSKGAIDKGREIHASIVRENLEQHPSVGNALVDMYSKCGCIVEAQEVFDDLLAQDVALWNTLLATYAERGHAEELQGYFQQMQLEGLSPDVVSWNTVIVGYTEQGEGEKVLKAFMQLQEQGLLPSNSIFANVLKACGNVGVLEAGKKLHARVQSSGVVEVVPATALIDMYGKCGSVIHARKVFDTMPTRDLLVWNTLITGYAHQGESQEVFHLFERMKQEGIQPDGVTFLNVLTACSHAGLIDRGLGCFHYFNKNTNSSLTVKHYSCLVDLLGRTGQIHEAAGMVEMMPCQPDLVAWSAMLGACRKWANVELGRQAFESAVRLDETHAASYALMSSIYADTPL